MCVLNILLKLTKELEIIRETLRELKFIILYKLSSTCKILKILGKFIETQFLQSIEYIDVFDNLR